MSVNTSIRRPDGTELGAYLARPAAAPRGAVVVLQEIFGVNAHIRAVADRFAAAGYVAIAPALFDRHAPGLELDYTPEGSRRGRALKGRLALEESLDDIRAGVEAVRAEGPVGIVGYCWGGFLAWQAAARVQGIAAAVCYYGGGITAKAPALPVRVPVMLHFGRRDPMIPLAEVEAFAAARPDVETHLYDAGHGFNCDRRESFEAESAALALRRTLEFLQTRL